MTIQPVTGENFPQAAGTHTLSWRASHRHICSPEFLSRRDCAGYLRRWMEEGKRLFLLLNPEPVGIVSIQADTIGDLYVHPEKKAMGYGSALLEYALTCTARPRRTVLSDNNRAITLYERYGFIPTGREFLRDGLWEVTMEKRK